MERPVGFLFLCGKLEPRELEREMGRRVAQSENPQEPVFLTPAQMGHQLNELFLSNSDRVAALFVLPIARSLASCQTDAI